MAHRSVFTGSTSPYAKTPLKKISVFVFPSTAITGRNSFHGCLTNQVARVIQLCTCARGTSLMLARDFAGGLVKGPWQNTLSTHMCCLNDSIFLFVNFCSAFSNFIDSCVSFIHSCMSLRCCSLALICDCNFCSFKFLLS